MKRAVVLSGGGARGAYQVGVWKALRKLKINYDIVTGTSIGAVNGLMMVQNEFYKTHWLWSNITFDSIYDTPFPKKYDTFADISLVYKKYFKQFLENGGVNTKKVGLLIDRAFNERKFFKSRIDYGLVTFNLSAFKPTLMTKEKLKGQNIRAYVLASATCYPAFQKTIINDEQYIDGGYYDNMPINLAIELGATEIIAVDLRTVGFVHKSKKDIKITYIKPQNKIGSFLVFDKIIARKAIQYGYNDTMKTFNKLDGNKYTFKHNHLDINYNYYHQVFIDKCQEIFKYNKENKSIYDELLKLSTIRKIINNDETYIRKTINDNLEFLGKIYNIDDSKIYSIHKYHRLLKIGLEDSESISIKYIEEKIHQKELKKLINSQAIIKYIYNLMDVEEYTITNRNQLLKISFLFPKDFIAAIYLLVINKN
ncbi:MAG: patatin-like phospholipase family protein [Bacilli bacterium]|nr:patatin-like phospholipase family protein [Bacilli bacterium]MDD4808883.1 patatin-like phospholipase family protein [Bacilli bacterium]